MGGSEGVEGGDGWVVMSVRRWGGGGGEGGWGNVIPTGHFVIIGSLGSRAAALQHVLPPVAYASIQEVHREVLAGRNVSHVDRQYTYRHTFKTTSLLFGRGGGLVCPRHSY